LAKLKSPLFSFEARGSVADTLTFFPWKGINAVREKVTPTNPRTNAQIVQRGRMSNAVSEFHTAGYSEADMTAWARLASAENLIMTGFNRMVKEYVDEAVAGNTWTSIHDVVVSAVIATQFVINVTKVSAGLAPYVRYGTRKTFMPLSTIMVDQTGNNWKATIAGLVTGTLYYFSVDVGVSGATWGRVGTYMQRTA